MSAEHSEVGPSDMTDRFFPWRRVVDEQVGEEVSLLVMTDVLHHVVVGCKQLVQFDEAVPPSSLLALHCWRVESIQDDVVFLGKGPHSIVVHLPPAAASDFCRVSEVCAGIGGTLFGAVQAGMRPLVGLDKSSLSCELLRGNAVPIVLQGDIQHPQTWARFHLAHPLLRFGLLAGFPCQPFSTLGWSLAFSDVRSRTFFAVLALAWLTQAAFVLLECVTGAGKHTQVQQTLAEFCDARGFQMACTVLHLDQTFPCRRTRWWCLMYPTWLPKLEISDLPCCDARQSLFDVFPFWPVWPLEEELELKLTERELLAYDNLDFGFSLSDRLLNMSSKCPTLLHSMGNVLDSCPCSCRGPLSVSLLTAQGLHGVLVKSSRPEIGYRHLHPLEAAYLLGVPAECHMGTSLRGALSQLGQLASPFQSHWMIRHFQVVLGIVNLTEVQTLQEDFVQQHMRSHLRAWLPPSSFWQRQIEVHYEDASSVLVSLQEPSRVSDLLLAEAQLGRDLNTLMLVDAFGTPDWEHWLIGSWVCLTKRTGCGPLHGLSPLVLGLDDLTMTLEGTALVRQAGLVDSQFLAPRNLTVLLELWPSCAVHLLRQFLPCGMEMHGMFLLAHHWIYFRCEAQHDLLHVHVYDGLLQSIPLDLMRVFQLLQTAWNLSGLALDFQRPIPQTFGFHCGTIALLTLGACLGLWPLPSESLASQIHLDLLDRQLRRGLGPSDENSVLEWLQTFLPSKGVPPEHALARAKLALQRLGLPVLREALQQKDPWKALKQAGNVTGKPFQWVTFVELQQHVEARGHVGPKPHKAKKPKAKARNDPVVALSPETVVLYPSSFVDDHEDPVPPLTFPEVESNARGVCVVTMEQALEFQKLNAHLSTDALAVVSIGEIPPCPDLVQQDLQWPALYVPTKEPILVKGTLLMLGDVAVGLAKTANAPIVATLDTEVIRISAFKDVFSKDWQLLLKGPVKHLLSLLPALQACPDPSCGGVCKFFHAACDEDVMNPVLDVWAWRWTNLDNRPVPVEQAVVFSVFMRIPHSALKQVLTLSGWFGIFLEPRPASKQGPHPSFAVVWLPRAMDLTAALDLKRKHDHIIGVARMQTKLGLRVLRKHEAETLDLIHPGQKLANCVVERVYELGPLPHGLSQLQVAELLAAWNWVAKPLRPARSLEADQYWDIGTSQDPPAAVLHTATGSVTVTCKKERTRGGPALPSIQASTRTKKHIQTSLTTPPVKSGVDPWLAADPWQTYQPSTNIAADHSGQEVVFLEGKAASLQSAKTKIDDLEERLMKQMDQKFALQGPPGLTAMDTDESSRQAVQIQELQAQATKFESWFTDVSSRFGKMDQQLLEQHSQMSQMQESLEAQQQTTKHLQHALEGLNISFRTELQSSMEARTSRLEALPEKRARSS